MRLATAVFAVAVFATQLRASHNSERAHSLVLSADSVEIYGEREDRAKATIVHDPDWIRRFAETMATIEFKGGTHVFGIGYLTAHFLKDGVEVFAIGLIPGPPTCYLRARSQVAGADFEVTKDQYDATAKLIAEQVVFAPSAKN